MRYSIKRVLGASPMQPPKKPGNPAAARRLREVRESRKLTQEGLARRLRVALSTIQRWETASTGLSTGRLLELAVVLQCDQSVLLEPPGRAIPKPAAASLEMVLGARPTAAMIRRLKTLLETDEAPRRHQNAWPLRRRKT